MWACRNEKRLSFRCEELGTLRCEVFSFKDPAMSLRQLNEHIYTVHRWQNRAPRMDQYTTCGVKGECAIVSINDSNEMGDVMKFLGSFEANRHKETETAKR